MRGELTAKEADAALNGLMWMMAAPIAKLVPDFSSPTYSQAEVANIVANANRQIEKGNATLRKVQQQARQNVAQLRSEAVAMQEAILKMSEHITELEAYIRHKDAEVSELHEAVIEQDRKLRLPQPDRTRGRLPVNFQTSATLRQR